MDFTTAFKEILKIVLLMLVGGLFAISVVVIVATLLMVLFSYLEQGGI